MNRMLNLKTGLIINQGGMSLPIALFLILAISAASSILSNAATQNLKEVKITESTNDSFYIAEGALQDFIGQLGAYSQLWREKVVLAALPLGQVQYSPITYASTNGIPSCSGIACHRKMYPVGGGVLKNFGPLGGAGDIVDTTKSITNQLDQSSLPTADITLNNRNAWFQVERLDETSPGKNSIGASLTNNDIHGSSSSAIRYRVTSIALRTLKNKTGLSTLITVLELPPT